MFDNFYFNCSLVCWESLIFCWTRKSSLVFMFDYFNSTLFPKSVIMLCNILIFFDSNYFVFIGHPTAQIWFRWRNVPIAHLLVKFTLNKVYISHVNVFFANQNCQWNLALIYYAQSVHSLKILQRKYAVQQHQNHVKRVEPNERSINI